MYPTGYKRFHLVGAPTFLPTHFITGIFFLGSLDFISYLRDVASSLILIDLNLHIVPLPRGTASDKDELSITYINLAP